MKYPANCNYAAYYLSNKNILAEQTVFCSAMSLMEDPFLLIRWLFKHKLKKNNRYTVM